MFGQVLGWLARVLVQFRRPGRAPAGRAERRADCVERAGLVTRGRDAQRRPCRLRTEPLDGTAGWIDEHRHRTADRYDRLDRLLSEMEDET